MKLFFAASLLAFLLSPISTMLAEPAPATGASAPPNIILILTDDLDTAAIPRLPRLKSLLADHGTTFSSFLVSDSLCCPSRSTILRGQYIHNHHVLDNDPPDGGFEKFHDQGLESSTIATWLHAAGYRTILLGKYLNGYPVEKDKKYVPPGWDSWMSPVDGTPYAQLRYSLNDDGDIVFHGRRSKNYLGDVLTLRATRYIRESVRNDRPFFMYLAPYTPHKPYTPPRRHEREFEGATAPRPPSFNEPDVSDKPEWFRGLPLLSGPEIAEIDEVWRARLQAMLGVEDMVAGVLDALKEAGKLGDTYLFFASDNGYHLGAHRLLPGKQTAFEEDIRVPLIVRGPGVARGAVLPHLVGNVDLAPTFAELAGVPPPGFVDGISFAPLLRPDPPPTSAWRQAFLLEHAESVNGSGRGAARRGGAPEGTREPAEADHSHPNRTIDERNPPAFSGLRLQDSLYVEHASGERELYDLSADPWELQNIAGAADPSLMSRLASDLERLRRCAGVSCR